MVEDSGIAWFSVSDIDAYAQSSFVHFRLKAQSISKNPVGLEFWGESIYARHINNE
jgi:hypothetical protein